MASDENVSASFSLVTLLAVVLVGYVVYEAIKGIGSGASDAAKALQDYINGLGDTSKSTAANQQAISGIDIFPADIIIPGTGGLTTTELYYYGFTTEQIKAMLSAYQTNMPSIFVADSGASITIPGGLTSTGGIQ